MEILLAPSYLLTTNHSSSHHGIPVLVISGQDAVGPEEIIKFNGAMQPAAHVVHQLATWMDKGGVLNDQEAESVEAYLSQWPDGPQFTGEE